MRKDENIYVRNEVIILTALHGPFNPFAKLSNPMESRTLCNFLELEKILVRLSL